MYWTNPPWTLTTKLDLIWNENSTSWIFPLLKKWQNYSYKIFVEDDKWNTSSSAVLSFKTNDIELITPTPPSTYKGWGWGWGWSVIVCKNTDYKLSDYSISNLAKLIKWKLNFAKTNWKIAWNIIMEDCDSTYKLMIEKWTIITWIYNSPFNWILEINKMSKNDIPKWTWTLLIIWGYNAWKIHWEWLKFSSKFTLTVPIPTQNWINKDKVKIYYYKNWEFKLARDGWAISTNWKFISIKLNYLDNIFIGYDKEIPEVIQKKLHSANFWCLTQSNIPINFTDTDSHWAEWFIKKAYNLWIIKWRSRKNFYPDSNITRAELSKIAITAFCLSIPEKITKKPFKDVPTNKWYSYYIESAKIHNLINGYNDNTAKPDKEITRAEALKILLKAAWFNKIEESYNSKFQDVARNDWYYSYVYFANQLWIIEWYNNTRTFLEIPIINLYLLPWSKWPQILSLQKILKELGYFEYNLTGYYWPLTVEAVAKYQLDKWIIKSWFSHGAWSVWVKTKPLIDNEIKKNNERIIEKDLIFKPNNSITRAEAIKITIKLIDMK